MHWYSEYRIHVTGQCLHRHSNNHTELCVNNIQLKDWITTDLKLADTIEVVASNRPENMVHVVLMITGIDAEIARCLATDNINDIIGILIITIINIMIKLIMFVHQYIYIYSSYFDWNGFIEESKSAKKGKRKCFIFKKTISRKKDRTNSVRAIGDELVWIIPTFVMTCKTNLFGANEKLSQYLKYMYLRIKIHNLQYYL